MESKKHTSGFGGSQKTCRYFDDRNLNMLGDYLCSIPESGRVILVKSKHFWRVRILRSWTSAYSTAYTQDRYILRMCPPTPATVTNDKYKYVPYKGVCSMVVCSSPLLFMV